jgi:hypothetical protein
MRITRKEEGEQMNRLTDEQLRELASRHTFDGVPSVAAECIEARARIAAMEIERAEFVSEAKKMGEGIRDDLMKLAEKTVNEHGQQFTELLCGVIAERDDLRSRLDEAGTDGWVPCSERLPTKADGDEWGNVIACNATGSWTIPWWSFRDPHCAATHWQPLPAPIRGGAADAARREV